METYKGWRLEGGRIYPSNYNQPQNGWETATLTATCAHGCDVGECLEKHPACTCGIYSKNNLKSLLEEYPMLDIYGIVYNHGVVVEGERGVRAEKATIRVLYTADITLAKILQHNYPGVTIEMPPKEILELDVPAAFADIWRVRREKKNARRRERQAAIDAAKIKYPGGPKAEKERLMKLLKNASLTDIVEFAKEYGNSGAWMAPNWVGYAQKRSKGINPGDVCFETNNDTTPYVFVGSTRDRTDNASIRYLLGRNGILVKRAQISKWNEDESLTEARLEAIKEWE